MIEMNDMEKIDTGAATSKTGRELQEARAAEAEEEDEEEEEEGDDDEDEEEEEEGEGDEEEDEEEEEDEGAEETGVPDDIMRTINPENRFMNHSENLREKYNEVELDSFMKLLNVKPHV